MKKQAILLLFFFFLCAASGQSQSLTFNSSVWGDYNFIKSNNESNDTVPKLGSPIAENPVATEPKKATKAPLIADNQSSKEVEFFHGSFQEAKKRAAAEKKYIFIDVYTTWCGPCKKMAAEAFTDEEVAELMNTFFINYKADAEAGGSSIATQYNVRAYPTTLIIDSAGAVVQVNTGYGGVDEFLGKIERTIAFIPNGSFYLTAKAGYPKNKKNFNYILAYASLRRKLKMSNEPLIDDFIKNTPLDSFQLTDYQQFIYGYATQLDSKTFDFILKNRALPMFNLKLEQLIVVNLNIAIQHKDKNLLKRIFKANERIINDPSVSAERNEQLALKYYEKTNAKKEYHKAAVDLLTTYYLPQLNDATTKNIDTMTNRYTTKIQEIGTYYSANIKDKKQLELMAELISKACAKHECPELISVYSQLLYRLGTVDKAKEWMTKAVKLSGNAKDMADLLDKMQKGVF
jgi:thioredoxin-related protein